MMRNSQNSWQYAGMLAKVAGQSSVITNVNRGGGYAISIENALFTCWEDKTKVNRLQS